MAVGCSRALDRGDDHARLHDGSTPAPEPSARTMNAPSRLPRPASTTRWPFCRCRRTTRSTPTLLPSTEATASSAAYEGGTCEVVRHARPANAMWTITALGLYDNPTGLGRAGPATAHRQGSRSSRPTPSRRNNPAWNYIYAGTGSTCDMTLNNNSSPARPACTWPATSADPKRASRPIHCHRRREPRRLEQRGGGGQHEHEHAGRDVRRRKLPLQRRCVGGLRWQPGREAHLRQALGRHDRRERDNTARRPAANGGLRAVVRERDPGPVARAARRPAERSRRSTTTRRAMRASRRYST